MRNRTIYIGIDIGKQGAIVGIDRHLNVIGKFAMPLTASKEISLPKLLQIFKHFKERSSNQIVGMEDVHSIKGASAKSNFQFGRGLGIIEGIVGYSEIPYVKVSPARWQKVAHVGVPIKKLAGKTKNDTKAMSLIAAERLFPTTSFLATERSKVPHDGIVDALLIAYFLTKA